MRVSVFVRFMKPEREKNREIETKRYGGTERRRERERERQIDRQRERDRERERE